MRALSCTEFGAPENLRMEERPAPLAGPGQVVVAVRACGVNFVDTLLIQGLYQWKPQPPFVPGGEIAGTVEAVGEGVTEFRVGDPVMAMTGLGAFAERVLVPAAGLYRLPEGLGFERGANFIQAYCTGFFALEQRARLRSGETVLVLGASGGVGLAAIDLAKAMGARVIAAASSPEGLVERSGIYALRQSIECAACGSDGGWSPRPGAEGGDFKRAATFESRCRRRVAAAGCTRGGLRDAPWGFGALNRSKSEARRTRVRFRRALVLLELAVEVATAGSGTSGSPESPRGPG